MKPDFDHPHFADPGWLWLTGLGTLLAAALLVWAERARGRQLARLVAAEFLAGLLRGHSPFRRRIKDLLLVIALLVLGLAMARPQWGREQEQSVSLGEDVIFLLDGSASMDSTDVRPSRLSRAKLAIGDFAREYHNGRIGLIVFAGQAFLQCPLTYDFDAFQESLNAVDTGTIPVPGTDIGRALSEGYSAVENSGRRKIMVLVSDGEDLEQRSIKMAQRLGELGVTIHTVGIGTPAGSQIIVADAHGVRAPLKDADGNVVVSKLDEPTLRAIATATHGTYQALGPAGEGLGRVRAMLSDAGGLHQFLSTRLTGVDHYHYWVAFGLILLVVESLLGTRRRSVRLPGAGVAARLVLAAGLAGGMWGGGELQAAEGPGEAPVTPRQLYNQGTEKLKLGQLHDAENSLNDAVPAEADPLQPRTLYNLGIVRFRAGKELLQQTPDAAGLQQRAAGSLNAAQMANRSADAALAGDDLEQLMQAYQFGRMSRHYLKQSQKELQSTLETYDKTLARWMRSWGDFKSAVELQPGYTNAQFNADVLEKNIAELQQKKQQLQSLQDALSQAGKGLKDRMGAMKKKMPGDPGGETPGNQGDDGDEDNNGKRGQGDNDEPPKTGPAGDQEQGNTGSEAALTPEEAERLLSSLHSDLTKKYSFGDDREHPEPPRHPKKTW